MKILWNWKCIDCGNDYTTPYHPSIIECPSCSSVNVTRLVSVTDSGKGYEFYDLKQKDDSFPSKKKLRCHSQFGTKIGGDGHLVNKKRVIDKNADHYEELVVDNDTGEILRDIKEPLSQHHGRGSAKRSEDIC